MQYDDLFLMPTQFFYQKPMVEDYEIAKKSYLTTLDPSYESQSILDKWTALIEKFSALLQTQHMPTERIETHNITKKNTAILYTIESYQKMLLDFKNMRIAENSDKPNSGFTLDKYVEYFEDFLFLYTTADSHFQLKDLEKKSLLQAIHECIAVCATGKNGEFYMVLQDHQKSLNWMHDELTKSRNEIVRRISETYNNEKESIMYFDLFIDIANEHDLGIPKKRATSNVFVKALPVFKQFFLDSYLPYFCDYEDQAIETLVLHYTTELITVSGINAEEWNDGPVMIESTRVGDVTQSLCDRFGVNGRGYFYQLAEEIGIETWQLKSREEVSKHLRSLIVQKLIADKAVVAITPQISLEDLEHIKLHASIHRDEFFALCQALHTTNITFTPEHETIIRIYPDMLRFINIEKNLNILNVFPKKLLNDHRIVLILLSKLNDLLCAKMDAGASTTDLMNILKIILDLTKSHDAYLQHLSDKIFIHPDLVKVLMEGRQWLYPRLVTSLQESYNSESVFDLVNNATPEELRNQAQLASIALQEIHPKANERIDDSNKVAVLKKHLQVNNLHYLCQEVHIPALSFMYRIETLNPQILMHIIKLRKSKGLPNLPFCEHLNTSNLLKNFDTELIKKLGESNGGNWFDHYKTGADKQRQFYVKHDADDTSAHIFLAESSHWFHAFKRYQHHQKSYQKMRIHLWNVGIHFVSFLINVISLSFFGFVYPAILGFLYHYIIPHRLTINLLLVGMFFNGYRRFPDSDTFVILAMIIGIISFANWSLMAFSIVLVLGTLFAIGTNLVNILHFIGLCMTDPFASLFTGKPSEMQSAQEKIQYIILRLKMNPDPAAQEKAQVLHILQTFIEQEREENCTTDYETLIKKPYSFSYKDETYHLSFSEVAAIRRTDKNAFSLKPAELSISSITHSVSRFFNCNRPTTSEGVLENKYSFGL